MRAWEASFRYAKSVASTLLEDAEETLCAKSKLRAREKVLSRLPNETARSHVFSRPITNSGKILIRVRAG